MSNLRDGEEVYIKSMSDYGVSLGNGNFDVNGIIHQLDNDEVEVVPAVLNNNEEEN